MKKSVFRAKYNIPEDVIVESVEEALEMAAKAEDSAGKHATTVKIDLEEPKKKGRKKKDA
jgi:hypothetical protein